MNRLIIIGDPDNVDVKYATFILKTSVSNKIPPLILESILEYKEEDGFRDFIWLIQPSQIELNDAIAKNPYQIYVTSPFDLEFPNNPNIFNIHAVIMKGYPVSIIVKKYAILMLTQTVKGINRIDESQLTLLGHNPLCNMDRGFVLLTQAYTGNPVNTKFLLAAAGSYLVGLASTLNSTTYVLPKTKDIINTGKVILADARRVLEDAEPLDVVFDFGVLSTLYTDYPIEVVSLLYPKIEATVINTGKQEILRVKEELCIDYLQSNSIPYERRTGYAGLWLEFNRR